MGKRPGKEHSLKAHTKSKNGTSSSLSSPSSISATRSSVSGSSYNKSIDSSTVAMMLTNGLMLTAVYIYTMYPSIPGGDSGELIAAAHELGVAHPPGYPLFTVLAWMTIKVVPVGNIAWRVGLLNAVLAGGASFILSLAIYRHTRSLATSLFGCWLWSFSKLTWTWSTTAEVFGLNNLFIATLIYLMVNFEQTAEENKHKAAYIGAFVCGLSLCNQHTIVVYVGVIAMWVLAELRNIKALTVTRFLIVSACFLTGLVPYIYLPLSSKYSPARWTWGDQSTWAGFRKHLLREEYGTFDLAKGQEGEAKLLDNLLGYAEHCIEEFSVVGVLLCVVGIVTATIRHSRCVLVTAAMCVVYLVLFSWRANLALDNPLFLGVVERFWMQADCVVVLLAALGLNTVFSCLYEKIVTLKKYKLELGVAVLALSFQMQKNFTSCNQRNNTVAAEFGSRLLNNMPRNALVLTVGDLPSNLLRYMYLCDNNRSDVQVLDNELLTYRWFVPRLRHAYPNITFPGHHMEKQTGVLDNGKKVFNSRTFLEVQYKRYPIVACIGMQTKELSWMEAFETFPYGPCSILAKKGESVNLKSLLQDAQRIAEGWPYPFEGFDGRTWERVATDEMWSARINIPLRLYEVAVTVENTDPKMYANLMTQSYQLYKAAVDSTDNADIPYYWHTDYGLACERMMRLKHNIPLSELLNCTIFHFEQTVQKNPHDKDVPLIKKSIENLKQYVGKL